MNLNIRRLINKLSLELAPLYMIIGSLAIFLALYYLYMVLFLYTHTSLDANAPIKYHYINLDKSKNRLANLKKQAAANNLTIERFAAVDGALVKFHDLTTNELFYGIDLKEKKTAINLQHSYAIYCNPSSQFHDFIYEYNKGFKGFIYKSAIKPGEIGLICSTLKLYQEISKEKEYTIHVIFEDDAQLIDNFPNEMRLVKSNLPRLWDLIYLGYDQQEISANNDAINTFNPLAVKRLLTAPSRLHGYAINTLSAQKLADLISNNANFPLDELFIVANYNSKLFKFFYYEHNIVSYNSLLESTIQVP